MSQIFFLWPHGGKSVSVAGTFNNWTAHPLQKQGNYWFGVVDLSDGVYQYKYIVDGRWVYDIGQIHADDGSGNWNNEVEVGNVAHYKEPALQPVSKPQQAKEQSSHQKPQQKQQQQQQQQPKEAASDQPQQKSKKQLKREQRQQQKEEKKQEKKQEPEPQPEPVAEPEPEAQPEPEPEAQPEPEAEAQPEAEPEMDVEPEMEPEVEAEAQSEAEVETPQVEQKKEKVLISIITLEVVAQQDANMAELEKFVRSIVRPGLKWEGSAVKPHFFGLEKLEIICQARDDVAIEGDVIEAIQANEELVSGASILGFAC